jgi:hypothetical protein
MFPRRLSQASSRKVSKRASDNFRIAIKSISNQFSWISVHIYLLNFYTERIARRRGPLFGPNPVKQNVKLLFSSLLLFPRPTIPLFSCFRKQH